MAQSPEDNPLIELSPTPAFDRISAQHVVPAIEHLLAEAEARLEKIETTTEALSYENSLGALEAATERLEFAMSIVEHLEAVNSSSELRTAYNTILPGVSQFYSSIPLRKPLWDVLTRFAQTSTAAKLDDTQKRLLKKTLADFKRHGAELSQPDKDRLKELERELSQLTTQFAQNVLDSTHAFELLITDEKKLSGLTESTRAAARESARAKGQEGFRFVLQAPMVISVLTHADDRSLRETIWRAWSRRGADAPYDNRPLVERIIELRREKAKLLGFENFADLVTEDRMAESGQRAQGFVRELTDKSRSAFERENQALLDFCRKLSGNPDFQLEAWDVAYYAEKQRKALYDFDEEQLRAYFPAESVLEGAFETARRLYGVRIEAEPSVPVWHDTVRAYRIVDSQTELLAIFYVDLFPRETKRDGAWMHGLRTAVPPDPNIALFCANATPPTEGRPSLMSHRDVETVFHEFGHLLHHCLSTVSVRSLAGTRVAQDFVELPSQIMENWCSEQEGLNTFARHYKTLEPVPQELLSRLLRARTYRAANAQMRQLGFAALDLALHIDYDPKRDGDVIEYANRILGEYSPTKLPAQYSLLTSFSHLFAHPVGYAAGYYSYKWAEVLDADAFTRFKSEGLFNPEVGRQFREHILSRGDSRDPMALFEAFMGRPPRLDPMLERQGLLHA